MLNCTATCRGADKKPRDNKLERPMAVIDVDNSFGGANAMITDNTIANSVKTWKSVFGAIDFTKVITDHGSSNCLAKNIGLGELSPLCRVTGRCAPD